MEETNFVLLWKEQHSKIDESLIINKKLLLDHLNQKAQHALSSLSRSKVIGIIIAILYLILLGLPLFYAIINYRPSLDYFIISVAVIFLINVKALYDYIKHLVMIHNIDYSSDIIEIQQSLTHIHISIVEHIRNMFLQLPFWTTFFLSSSWFPSKVNAMMLILQVFISISFTVLAIFLYKNLTINNMHKRWVTAVLSGAGGKKIMKALEFYKEIETFKLNK